MDKRGKFIVIDGMDGSGKGTQIALLQKRLAGRDILFTREPGGSPKAEEIRTMLLQTDGPPSNPTCDFFLFWAARGSHVQDTVAPARAAGRHVICDRYDSSTYAFQLWGEESPPWLWDMFKRVRGGLPPEYEPDLYLFLTLPPEVAHERRRKDAEKERDRFDLKPLEYHRRVRDGFERFAYDTRSRAVSIDADHSPEKVHEAIWKAVSAELGI